MSKFIVDDPWLEYLEIPDDRCGNQRYSGKHKRALSKRIAKFRRSRRTKPFTPSI